MSKQAVEIQLASCRVETKTGVKAVEVATDTEAKTGKTASTRRVRSTKKA